MKKSKWAFAAAGAVFVSSTIIVDAAGWKLEPEGWRYYESENGYVYNGWKIINGKLYHFNSQGTMDTGWIKDKSYWFYLNKNGDAVRNDWKQLQGKWYYFRDDCRMVTGWLSHNGVDYYLKSSGEMAIGWQKIDNQWYCFNASGKLLKSMWISGTGTDDYVDSKGVWIQSKKHEESNTKDTAVYTKDLKGFFQYCADQGSRDAEFALVLLNDLDGNIQDGRNNSLEMLGVLDDAYDGFTLENVYAALDGIEQSNQIRKAQGLPVFQVNHSMMAIANKCLAWSNQYIAHSGGFNIGENLAWGFSDPFQGWFYKEEVLYQNGERNKDVIGHYLNLMNEKYVISGYACSSHSRYSSACQQSFVYSHDQASVSYNMDPMSVSEYRQLLKQFELLVR